MRVDFNEGSPELAQREELISECKTYVARVVSSIMRRFALPAYLKDDFLSAGFLGLVEAAQRFDFREGSSFRPYAFLRIRGAVIDCLRRSSDLSGYGYQMAKALRAAYALREELSDCNSGPPQSKQESLSHILEYAAKSALAYRLSLDGKEARGSAHCHNLQDPERTLAAKQDQASLRRLVQTLPAKERLIVEEYYFNDKSFAEICDKYAGMSRSWVSRLHSKALERLRARILKEGV